jgi:hypothetical protein
MAYNGCFYLKRQVLSKNSWLLYFDFSVNYFLIVFILSVIYTLLTLILRPCIQKQYVRFETNSPNKIIVYRVVYFNLANSKFFS